MRKCLLSTAVEAKAGRSVEDSGLLFDCELNEETEWDREQQLTNFSSQHIPGQAVFLNTSYPRAASPQVKLTSLSVAITLFGCSLHSSRHHLDTLSLERIQSFRH